MTTERPAHPPPFQFTPDAAREWDQQTRDGVRVRVELYQQGDIDAWVRRWTVRRVKPGLYRGVILYELPETKQQIIQGYESSADDVVKWMRTHGVPALRIGSALPT